MSSETIVVRDAAIDEMDEVSALILEAFAEFEGQMPRDVWVAARHEWADVWARLAEAQLLVAEVNGRLVGSVTFYPEASLSRTEAWPAGWAAIRVFTVRPDARRLGVGGQLTEECVRRARACGVPCIALKTTTFMFAARASYEAAGFVRAPDLDHAWTGEGVAAAGEGIGVDVFAYVLKL
jgi:GNAT superfamily N-acetyltransferase